MVSDSEDILCWAGSDKVGWVAVLLDLVGDVDIDVGCRDFGLDEVVLYIGVLGL